MNTSARRRSHVFTMIGAGVLLSMVAPGTILAQARTDDVVVMVDGDRLTGEIKGLSKGRLSFDAKPTGVVSVKWNQVAALTSQYTFYVETKEGTRLVGRLAPTEPGKLAVVGDVRSDVDLAAVVGLARIRRSFLSRLDGSVNVGGSYTQSSGVAQLSAAVTLTARRPSFEWRASADDYVTFESDGMTTERFGSDIGYSRYISQRWALFGGGQVERNADLGFTVRGTAGGGLERTLLRSNRSVMVAGGGLGASREVKVDGGAVTLLSALFNFRHSYYTYSTPKTSLDTTFNVYPILNQAGRWRLELNTSVSRELFKDFAIAFTVHESFDSRPPSADASRNDVATTLSLSFVF